MTHTTTHHETPASLLAPLARGLMHRSPEILSLSIHDDAGHALWSSGNFLLAEDHALIAEVIDAPHDVRGHDCGLWWQSADTARARCALAVFERGEFRGAVLVVYSSLSISADDRAQREGDLAPVLPVLGKAIRLLGAARLPAPAAHPVRAAKMERPDELVSLAREAHLLALIDRALREDEFALHLQPIVSLRDADAPLIVEVLIRLPTEEQGVLSSHEFLDTAERNGRMPAIDRWVIRALLVWMQRNRDRWADARAVFSVNLSGKSVVRPDFRDYLANCLDKSGLPLQALRFEVAELDAGLAPQEFVEEFDFVGCSRQRRVPALDAHG